jgi:hypothetical protein
MAKGKSPKVYAAWCAKLPVMRLGTTNRGRITASRIRLYRAGMTLREIAVKQGVTLMAVWQSLSRAGVEMHRRESLEREVKFDGLRVKRRDLASIRQAARDRGLSVSAYVVWAHELATRTKPPRRRRKASDTKSPEGRVKAGREV